MYNLVYPKSMQNLPTPEVYEREFQYMPWGILINEVLQLCLDLPQNSRVLDLMCGTGYLLEKIHEQRPDLILTGVDMEPEFIGFASGHYEGIDFQIVDVLKWHDVKKYDMVLCTAGLHHVDYSDQEELIKKIYDHTEDDGLAIVADPYLDDYSTEDERKIVSAKLGYEYLTATIKNGGDRDVITAAIDILQNDVLLVEFKNSINKVTPIFEKYFPSVERCKTWPSEDTEYGDYYFILKK
jgi:2-polyprenyl-3-methyl-5-hydroxy-6-metoxy-1,4-benzoquinol methylase